MSCGDIDLKAYFLGESSPFEKRDLEAHVGSCMACRLEFDRLGVTRAALLAIPEEEPPRRIAFVSDPVFEPSGWRRFWNHFNPVALLASTALAAVVAFAVVRTQMPEPFVGNIQEAVVVNKIGEIQETASSINQDFEERVSREVTLRLKDSLQEAVYASERRQQERTAEIVKAVEDRLILEHREQMLIMEASLEMLNKRVNTSYRAAADFGGVE
jgi:anti-sigma factor RsiW